MLKYDTYVRLTVAKKGEGFANAFGPGTAQLLRGVQQLNSLNQAAKKMGMAYSKAWKAIKNTESNLGITLLERKGPNGSVLTPEGEHFLAMYDEMARSAALAAQKAYEEFEKQGQEGES